MDLKTQHAIQLKQTETINNELDETREQTKC